MRCARAPSPPVPARSESTARRLPELGSPIGGSAPTRWQVSVATRTAKDAASCSAATSSSESRPRSSSSHRARKAPPNASPAPTVSTTSTRGTGTSKEPAGAPRQHRPRALRDEDGADAPSRSQRAEASVPGARSRKARSSSLALTTSARSQHAPSSARGSASRPAWPVGRQLGSTMTNVAGGTAATSRGERVGDRLQGQPERADVERIRRRVQRSARIVRLEPGRRGALEVPAVLGARPRASISASTSVVGAEVRHDQRGAHAVGLEPREQESAEPVVRDAAQEVRVAAESGDGPGRVVLAATRGRGDVAALVRR